MSDAEIGTLFMSRQLVSVASMLAVGWLAHRIGNVRGVLLALAAAAIADDGLLRVRLRLPRHPAVSLVWGGVWAPTWRCTTACW